MLAVVVAVTLVVETLKVAVIEPNATLTLLGTMAFTLFDESKTIVPPDRAGDAKVIVPTIFVPPTTEVVLKDRRLLPPL